MTVMKYKLIANPGAGRGRSPDLVARIVNAFKRKGVRFDLELTKGPADAARIARDAVKDHDVIVGIGGDGTINEIVPALLFSTRPFGIVPAGTGNDFIKSLNIPNHIDKAVEIVIRGKTKVIDAGKINNRYFANGVGIGFDAAVNRAGHSINHSRRGLLLYLCALLKTLGRYKPVRMTVTMNGETVDKDFFLLTVGNGTTVGGGFRLTPFAKLDDGLLDVTMIKPIALLPLLRHLPKVFMGTIDRAAEYATLSRTTKLIVESSAPVPVHLDGEIYPEDARRFEIEVVPRALTVIGNWE
jgi:YegS/Rv2252/BmrU family lipid kinase